VSKRRLVDPPAETVNGIPRLSRRDPGDVDGHDRVGLVEPVDDGVRAFARHLDRPDAGVAVGRSREHPDPRLGVAPGEVAERVRPSRRGPVRPSRGVVTVAERRAPRGVAAYARRTRQPAAGSPPPSASASAGSTTASKTPISCWSVCSSWASGLMWA
jgi:hypothetical protein